MKKNQQGNFSLTYPPRIRYILMAAIFSFYCLLFFSTTAHAQQRSVAGIITNEDHMPLEGVSVIEKGTNKGTSTDLNGKFELQVSNSTAVLVISYVGYKEKEVSLNNQASIEISLE